MKKLFVVHSFYNLFLSILLSIKSKRKNKIIVLNSYKGINKVIKKLEQSDIFEEVILINDEKITELNSVFRFLHAFPFYSKYLLKKYLDSNIKFENLMRKLEDYELILSGDYMFYELILNRVDEVSILEEGEALYIQNKKRGLSTLFRHIFKLNPGNFCSNKIQKIYCTQPERLSELKKEKAISINSLIDITSLNNLEKENITKIFGENKIGLKGKKDKVIILGQCFSVPDSFTIGGKISEKDQVDLYDRIIEKYYKKYEIYFKAHPKDEINYEKELSNKNIKYLKKEFPIEIFSLLYDYPIFKKAISVNSTACNNPMYAEEGVKLGEETLKKYFKH